MALVVLLRGVNVGGHRTFQPSVLAQQLSRFDVVNIGAAGTFVVRKPGSRTGFRDALLKKLPFETEIAMCDGREFLQLEARNPFRDELPRPDFVRFVSILAKRGTLRPASPILFPTTGEWLLRVVAYDGRYIFGEYRRQMKAIGYLGQIDKLFGVPATTRNWNTIGAVMKILKERKILKES
jgi:uncharacterized protein (DUF1697 family)